MATDRSRYPTRVSRLQDPEDDACIRSLTPAERMAMVWPLTLQARAFREPASMTRDFAGMLAASSAAGAEYLVVCEHALTAHGRPRASGDLDVRVHSTPESATGLWLALEKLQPHDATLWDLREQLRRSRLALDRA